MNKSKVKITGKGKLWDVDFKLKDSKTEMLKFTYSSDAKEWTSESFTHEKEILYELVVYARRGTGWEGHIEEVETGEKFIEWKLSKTNTQHQSKRSKPNKEKLA